MRAFLRLLPPAAALLMAGCPSSDVEPTVFWTDVGPIVEEHCVSCHKDGGVAPFRLDDYDSAAQWAGPSASAVASRSMPPFLVKADGTCGEFKDANWLTDAEIQTLQVWAQEGATKGDDYAVTLSERATLTGPTFDTSTPEFVPEIVGGDYAAFDEYRCFAVELGSDVDQYVTGYEVLPGNEAVVHHVIGYPVDMDAESRVEGRTNAEQIEILSAPQPDREGWPCFNGAGDEVTYSSEVVSWAPGQGAVLYPEGVGIKVEANRMIVYQVHYNLVDPATHGQSDQTTVRLQLADEVERPGFMTLPDLFLGGQASTDEIPAGQSEASVTFELPIAWVTGGLPLDFEVLGVLPHMHERGRKMFMSIDHADGANTCVAEVPAWDFNWQRLYLYDRPIGFTSDDTLIVECIYDTSDDTEPTTAGWGTRNEMCLPGVLAAVAAP